MTLVGMSKNASNRIRTWRDGLIIRGGHLVRLGLWCRQALGVHLILSLSFQITIPHVTALSSQGLFETRVLAEARHDDALRTFRPSPYQQQNSMDCYTSNCVLPEIYSSQSTYRRIIQGRQIVESIIDVIALQQQSSSGLQVREPHILDALIVCVAIHLKALVTETDD